MDEATQKQCLHAIAGLLLGMTGQPYERCFVEALKIMSIIESAEKSNVKPG